MSGRMRGWVKEGTARVLGASGAAAAVESLRGGRRAPLILGYHRVVADFEESAKTAIPSLLITARTLERHLEQIGRRRRFVSLDDLARIPARGGRADRVAAVTFDDGYRDVHEQALPLLQRMGIPAAVFVVADLVGTDGRLPHDRLYGLVARALWTWARPADEAAALFRLAGLEALARGGFPPARSAYAWMRHLQETCGQADLLAAIGALEAQLGAGEPPDPGGRPLTWEMLREMRAAGWVVGSHTRTHALLTHEPRLRQLDELAGSRRLLEARLGAPVEHLAYPDGCFDPWTVVAAEMSGYRYGYTICGHADRSSPLLTQRRRILWEGACRSPAGRFSPAVLRCQVAGVFDPFERCRGRHASVVRGAAGGPAVPTPGVQGEEVA